AVAEGGCESLPAELRVPPRAWLRPNVRKRLDIGSAQGRDELLEGSRAVTNGPNIHESSVEDRGCVGPTIRLLGPPRSRPVRGASTQHQKTAAAPNAGHRRGTHRRERPRRVRAAKRGVNPARTT